MPSQTSLPSAVSRDKSQQISEAAKKYMAELPGHVLATYVVRPLPTMGDAQTVVVKSLKDDPLETPRRAPTDHRLIAHRHAHGEDVKSKSMQRRYSQELKERAVRMVLALRAETGEKPVMRRI